MRLVLSSFPSTNPQTTTNMTQALTGGRAELRQLGHDLERGRDELTRLLGQLAVSEWGPEASVRDGRVQCGQVSDQHTEADLE